MRRGLVFVVVLMSCLAGSALVLGQSPSPTADDPLIRMPGTQPGEGVTLEGPRRCLNCHAGYFKNGEPGFNWRGSMMAHSARDFLFWPALAVAAQDSVWAVGRPNATDICLRCHTPKGWLEGRSDPTNGANLSGDDFDGVQCDFCHRMYDPFFEATFQGTRESDDWVRYWDETNASDTPSAPAAEETYAEDKSQAQNPTLFNGNPFFLANEPHNPEYKENAGGQYFVSTGSDKRGPFADAAARHKMLYSRYHKSKFFCSSCHDVSNPVLANLDFDGTPPGDGKTILPTEDAPAFSYFHVERTFSEFMLSAYGQQGGSAGKGPFKPSKFETSYPNNYIAKCQDCHMHDVVGRGANKNSAPIRPNGSIEHPNSGLPVHDLTGGNVWVPTVLASAIAGSPNYDPVNDELLNQGANILTMTLSEGLQVDPDALLAAAARARQQLKLAAAIKKVNYNATNGSLSFRLQNNTGHKLITGYPEGRRMFVNIRAYQDGNLIYEINPYDKRAGTLKGLSGFVYTDPDGKLPPPAAIDPARERYEDALVYEVQPSSTLTGESHTFHFALADGRYKDNRIPPKRFRVSEAAERLSEPAWNGAPKPNYFTAGEYRGGYDDVTLTLPPGADQIQIKLYYQTTSREYIEFLRDEINGGLAQSDPFFTALKAWGDTIWQVWKHNKNLSSAAPFLVRRKVENVTP